MFGPQKGADEEQVKILDAALAHYAAVLKDKLHCAAADTDGSGAAGGLLCGILPYFPVTICSGIDLVLDLTDFDEHVKQADLVITGEGRIDFQSALGKVPVGVAERAKKSGMFRWLPSPGRKATDAKRFIISGSMRSSTRFRASCRWRM